MDSFPEDARTGSAYSELTPTVARTLLGDGIYPSSAFIVSLENVEEKRSV